MKSKRSRTVVSFFILMGMTLLFYPFFKLFILELRLNQMQYIFDSAPASFEQSKLEQLNPPDMEQIMSMRKEVSFSSIIAFPTLDKELPISNELSDTSFLSSAVNMYPEREATTDNIVLLGHHLADKGLLFGDIEYLEVDDPITLYTDQYQYEYLVSERYIIDENNTSVLNNHAKPSRLTLITCDSPTYTSNRLIVEAELITKKPSDNKILDTTKTQQQEEDKTYLKKNGKWHSFKYVWVLPIYLIMIVFTTRILFFNE